MNNAIKVLFVTTMLFSTLLQAEIPRIISHQGRMTVNGSNFTGSGLFKFAFVDSSGVILWSNSTDTNSDGTPDEAISLTVQDGLYAVLLGDTNITGMAEISADVFTNSELLIRVWFNDNTNGWEQLSPDQRIAASGYAIQAMQLNGQVSSTSEGDLTVAGKVGINTTSPEYKLEVKTSDNSKTYMRHSTDTSTDATLIHNELVLNSRLNNGDRNYVRFSHGNTMKASIYSQSILENELATLHIINHTNSNILFKTNGQNERMIIDNNGMVGINTSNPQTRLHVNGIITATELITTSDARFKKDIQPIDDALNKISRLNGVYYNWKADRYPEKTFSRSRQAGVIAQNVEQVLPELVKTDAQGHKAVNYQGLTSVLLEAMKQQQTRLEEQQATIDTLSMRLQKLEQQIKTQNKQ